MTLGKYAKSSILKEVTAFANAYGGALVLGIKESGSRPPIASEILPLPRCADLAERLKMIFRDRVEPQIPQLEVFAVREADDSTDGVVVIRAGKSRLAPHRVTKTLSCPIRRADRCEEMPMREIQDMTLNVSRGLELLEKRFEARSKCFPEEFESLFKPEDAYGIRLTAIPIGGDVQLDNFFTHGGHGKLSGLPWCIVQHERVNLGPFAFGFSRGPWRPTLRGARAEKLPYSGSEPKSYGEIDWNGMIELGFILDSLWAGSSVKQRAFGKTFFLNWAFTLLATLATWVSRIREFADAPMSEYALEIEICSEREISVELENGPIKKLSSGSTKFHRYTFGPADDVRDLLASFFLDCWHLAGRDIEVKASDFEIEEDRQ